MLKKLNIVIFNFARKGKYIPNLINPDLYSDNVSSLQNININKNT